jgi:hypothetical protein
LIGHDRSTFFSVERAASAGEFVSLWPRSDIFFARKPAHATAEDAVDSDLEQTICSLLESEEIDRAFLYSTRGRRFADMPEPDLLDRWADAFRVWAVDFRKDHPDRLDLESELRLRNLNRPYQRVASEYDKLVRAARHLAEKIASNPKRIERIGNAFIRHAQAFRSKSAARN